MRYEPNDHYAKKAKKEGFRARSIYKLEAIQERFHLLKKGDKVLDLGAAPGSFLQFTAKIIGDKGFVVGVDLQEIRPFREANIHTVVADVLDEADLEKKLGEIGAEYFNVILSDMAPATSGVKFLDAGRSKALNEEVIRIANKYLTFGGNLVIKLLGGVNEGDLVKQMKPGFKTIRHFRPNAVRKTSDEFYLVGMNKIL